MTIWSKTWMLSTHQWSTVELQQSVAALSGWSELNRHHYLELMRNFPMINCGNKASIWWYGGILSWGGHKETSRTLPPHSEQRTDHSRYVPVLCVCEGILVFMQCGSLKVAPTLRGLQWQTLAKPKSRTVLLIYKEHDCNIRAAGELRGSNSCLWTLCFARREGKWGLSIKACRWSYVRPQKSSGITLR